MTTAPVSTTHHRVGSRRNTPAATKAPMARFATPKPMRALRSFVSMAMSSRLHTGEGVFSSELTVDERLRLGAGGEVEHVGADGEGHSLDDRRASRERVLDAFVDRARDEMRHEAE